MLVVNILLHYRGKKKINNIIIPPTLHDRIEIYSGSSCWTKRWDQ